MHGACSPPAVSHLPLSATCRCQPPPAPAACHHSETCFQHACRGPAHLACTWRLPMRAAACSTAACSRPPPVRYKLLLLPGLNLVRACAISCCCKLGRAAETARCRLQGSAVAGRAVPARLSSMLAVCMLTERPV